jgi:hypothetical protein
MRRSRFRALMSGKTHSQTFRAAWSLPVTGGSFMEAACGRKDSTPAKKSALLTADICAKL